MILLNRIGKMANPKPSNAVLSNEGSGPPWCMLDLLVLQQIILILDTISYHDTAKMDFIIYVSTNTIKEILCFFHYKLS